MSDTEVKQLIPQDAYRALEGIVGPENLTTDPVQCQAYTGRGYSREQWWYTGLLRRPACVILPKTTEEVARIVKVCNRYQIPYLPASAMWAIECCPRFRDDVVTVDLKRMNKLEIDEKNMYAIVEPAVIYAQLNEEALRRDLYTLASGGGSQASVLANHLTWGMAPLCHRLGVSERRMNAVEWVTPEGEIVRMGSSAVNDDSWYWQDGIGPNAMGILRGHTSWLGSMGIVTKMSVKLYPFQPQRLEPAGITPETYSILPPRVRFYNFTMPNREALTQGIYEVAKAQIAAMVQKVPVSWRVIAKTKDRNEYWQEWNKMTAEEIANTHILRVLLVGYTSQKQLEYEERVLTDIMNELGGIHRRTRQTDASSFKWTNAHTMWIITGSYFSNEGGIESVRCGIATCEKLGQKHYEYEPPLTPAYGDPGWFQSIDFGHQCYAEFLAYHDVEKMDPESPKHNKQDLAKAMQWYMSATPEIDVETGFPNAFQEWHQPIRMVAPAWHNYQIWLDRFKKEFDPQGVSNPPLPFATDEMVKMHPEFVTPKLKEAVDKVTQG